MEIAIAVTDDLDIHTPPIDLINFCISKHQNQLKHLDELDEYFLGKHEIFKRERKNEAVSNVKVMINHAKITTDTIVGFVTGNPISFSPSEGKNIDNINDALDIMDSSSHDTALVQDLSVFGVGYEVLYLQANEDNETVVKISVIDPRQCLLVTDSTLEKKTLFAVHYHKETAWQKKATDYYIFNVYTKTHIHIYKSQNLTINPEDFVESKEHFFKEIPIIEYQNNEERQGDFEQARSLIDAYNELQSNRLSDKQNFVEAILITYGFRVVNSDPKGSEETRNNGMMMSAPGKKDGADAEWLTKTFNESQVQVLADALVSDLHKVTYVPDLNDSNFGGTQTGTAMKYKLLGLLNLLANKQRYLSKGLRKRLKLIENMQNLKNVGSKQSDSTGVVITIKPNLPINLLELIQQIRDSQDFIPLEHSLAWLPDVPRPKELIQKLLTQQRQQAELNRVLLGASHEEFEENNHDDDGE